MTDAKSLWDKLGDAIQDPWDWAAATAGGGLGAVASGFLSGTDAGTSMAGGALVAVSLRKAGSAAMVKRRLRRRARALRNLAAKKPGNDAQDLRDSLDRELELLDSGAIGANDFARALEDLVEQYRAL